MMVSEEESNEFFTLLIGKKIMNDEVDKDDLLDVKWDTMEMDVQLSATMDDTFSTISGDTQIDNVFDSVEIKIVHYEIN